MQRLYLEREKFSYRKFEILFGAGESDQGDDRAIADRMMWKRVLKTLREQVGEEEIPAPAPDDSVSIMMSNHTTSSTPPPVSVVLSEDMESQPRTNTTETPVVAAAVSLAAKRNDASRVSANTPFADEPE